MTAAVVVAGPGAVRGPYPVSTEMSSAAIDAIDDEHTVIDDRVVAVDDVWAELIATACGTSADSLLVICPGWWSDSRADRIRDAAARHCADTAVLVRHETLPAGACIVEITAEFVICRAPGSPLTVTPRLGPSVAATVAHAVTGSGRVIVDVPQGICGAAELAADIAAELPRHAVDIVDDVMIAAFLPDEEVMVPVHRRRPVGWALAAGLLVAATAGLAATRTVAPAAHPVTLVTEGRVTVQLPADWPVRRITDGAGSPRIQAFSPEDDGAAILMTQSAGGSDLMGTAAVLRAAMELQPDGVFSGLRIDDHRARRPVLSYTETRADREIDWAVFLDANVRIAVGCQQPRSTAVIRRQCDAAIESARAVR